MNRNWWFSHPIFIFVFSTLALAASLFLYIYWYIEVSAGLNAVVRKFNLDSSQVLEPQTWIVVLVLSILVALILLGIFTIFVYNQKTLRLYRLQHNFINNFTHELKTPVTSLKLFLETFLKHDLARQDRRKYIDFMLRDVMRLSDNINRILDLAKLESKSYEGEFAVTDVAGLVREFLEENRQLFLNCKIRAGYPTAERLMCRIDRPLFNMLLMNLIQNAIQHNAANVPEIRIAVEKKNGKPTVTVADNGIGFDKSETQKIFKKFYQAGRSDDMTARGSGLGLYLVQNIAKLHKGKVVADSPGPGLGSRFTLTLPGATV